MDKKQFYKHVLHYANEYSSLKEMETLELKAMPVALASVIL